MRNAFLFTGLLVASLTQGLGAQVQATVLERGPHHRLIRNESGGTYTELANGVCYQDEAGNWLDSEELFEIVGTTAVARRGAYTVTLAANINSERVVELVAQGKRFVSRFAGISYFDAASGQNILVGRIQDSIAVVHPPNQVIYPDALVGDGFTADVRYTWRKGSFEQDVIFRGQPPAPEAFLLNPASTRIQAWTLFLEAPQPQAQTRIIRSEENAVLRLAMAEPDFTDQVLSFEGLQISQGRAFAVGDEQELPRSIPVGKEWGQAENGDTFLIESVEYFEAKASLDVLGVQGARLDQQNNRNVAALDRQQLMAALAKPTLGKKAPEAKLQMAKARDTQKGFAIDYEILTTYGYVDFVFAADKTYYINGQVNLSGGGTAVFEKGVVIKFPPYNYTNICQINITGSGSKLHCATGPLAAATLTARDDDSIGEEIVGSIHTPTGYYGTTALYFDHASSAVLSALSNVRIRYAKVGITYNTGNGHTLTHGQLINCETAISLYGGQAHTRNVLVANNSGYTYGKVADGDSYSTLRAENVTFHDVALRPSGSYYPVMYLTNSMLVAVNTSGYYNGFYNQVLSSADGVFATVGIGARYLSDDTYRDQGTTAIEVNLLADLRKRTTHAPVKLESDFTAPTTLSPEIPLDSGPIDLGYHFDKIDFLWSGRNLSSTLVLTGGVVVAHLGTRGTTLQGSAKFVSEGSPTQHNIIVPATLVQENRAVDDDTGATFGVFGTASGSSAEIHLRFTDISFPANVLPRRHVVEHANGNLPAAFSLTDCELTAPYLILSNSVAGAGTTGFTNNLWRRANLNIRRDTYTSVNAYLYNNTFLNSTVTLTHNSGTGTWQVHDNFFDTVTLIAGSSTFLNSHNGYFSTTGLSGSGGGDRVPTVRDYQSAALGTNYYPALNANQNNLGLLVGNGSRTPVTAGIYHHTVKPDQSKAGTLANVSIGYHYIALSGSQSINSDTDSLADYFEDRNGDNLLGADETNWAVGYGDTDGDTVDDGTERFQGRNGRVAGTVADTTGTVVSLKIFTPNR